MQGIVIFLLVIAFSLAFAYRIARGIREPLRELSAVTDSVAAGERKLRARTTGTDEIARVAERLNRMLDVLTRTESRFRSLVDLSSDFYWETDSEHRLTVRSEGGAIASLAAFGGAAVLGYRRWELPYLTPGAEGWQAHQADLEARRPFRGFEFSRPAPGGQVYHFSISGQPQFDAQGAFIGYQGVGSDLTERKREEQLRAVEHAVTRLLANAADERGGITAAIRAVCETMSWTFGRYWALDAASGMFNPKYSWAAENSSVWEYLRRTERIRLQPGTGIAGHVLQTGEPLWIEDLSNDARVVEKSLARDFGLGGSCAFPVTAEGVVIGVLVFVGRVVREPDKRVLEAMNSLGSQIGQFLSRKQAESVLRESETRYRSLAGLAADWYWQLDTSLRFTHVTREIGGADDLLADEGLIGKHPWELGYEGVDEARWAEFVAMAQSRQPFRDFEFAWRQGDGTLRSILVSGHPVFDAGRGFSGYRGISRDVTARRTEERMHALGQDVARFLAQTDAPEQAPEQVLRAVCEALQVDCGRYFELDEAAGEMRYAAAWSVEADQVKRFLERSHRLAFRPGEGLVGVVWSAGEALWVADMRQDSRFLNVGAARALGMHTVFLAPVLSDGRTVGVVAFFNRGVRPHDERALQAVQAVASQLGQYLGRARALLLRRRQAEALRDSHARLEMHSRRQEQVARFGQFALKHRSRDALFDEALDILADQAEVAVLFELVPGERLMLRAARGDGATAAVGGSAPLQKGSAAQRVLEGGQSVLLDQAYLAAAPPDWPWSGWMRRMRSGVFVAVAHEGHASGMLGVFSRHLDVFAPEAVRFAESIGYVLSTALQREDAERRLAFMAQFDSLTGLPNRSLLQDRLEQAIAQSRRRQRLAGVLFVDLDRFKIVNDTLGHVVGDQLLREVARRLQQCVRADDTVGRISGDEFAVVLADLSRPEDAGPVAQKVIDTLVRPFMFDGSEAFVSASIGISIYPTDAVEGDTLLRNADMAMYQAKESGRSAYRYFTAEMNERSAAKLQLNTDLRRAVERQEFALHYQPKVDLGTGALIGMEALLRWNHPQRGLIPPGEFISALEDSGLILPVGEWVLAEACGQIRRWQAAGLEPVPVAVNLSVKQFRRADLDRLIQQTLDAAGVPAALIELEITESSIADDPADAVRQMKNLRAAGLRMSVDDFGTGYSSLAYLTTLPISALKIDRSFVRDVHVRAESASIVQSVIDMAHNLRFVVVAEGVETAEHVAFLRSHGCDQAQGYYFGRPVQAAEIASRLAAAGACQSPGGRE
ncbi:MAG: EAL domain-containing protein [Burkholderiales bacterium]